jgi:hypothetical protein
MPVNVQPTTKTYVPKKPCKRCGTFLRYAAGRMCVECSRNHSRNYFAAHPEKYEAYKARRYEKKRLARARARQLRAMGRLAPTLLPKPSKVLAFTMRGRAVRFKHKALKPIIGRVNEAMDIIEVKSPPPIFGVMCAGESPDTVAVGGINCDLRQYYLAQLLKLDAIIWHQRQHRNECFSEFENDNDAHRKPGAAPRVMPPGVGVKYHREEPCPKCGTRERYASTGACVECLKRSNRAVKDAKIAARKLAAEREPVSRPGLRLSQVRRPETTAAAPNFIRVHDKQERWGRR